MTNLESKVESLVAQSCPALCDGKDYSLRGSSVHGIFQARVLKWVAISFSRGSPRPRDQTQVSHIVGKVVSLLFNMLSMLVLAQTVKRLPTMWEAQVPSLGWEDTLEKAMATHSSTLAWKIPWTEEPDRL